MMDANDSEGKVDCDQPFASELLGDKSNQSLNSYSVDSDREVRSGAQKQVENRALMVALGVSPGPSLGLGSSSSGQGDGVINESMSETTRQSNDRNISTLSNNVTIRKSLQASCNIEDEDDEGWSLVGVPKSDEDVVEAKSFNSFEQHIPEEVTAKPKGFDGLPMSPMMSPDEFRLSDEFERTMNTNYAAPIDNEEIAGLSPIMAIRESDISNSRPSPSEFRIGQVEVMVTHPEENNTSTSARDSVFQNGDEEHLVSREGLQTSMHESSVIFEAANEGVGNQSVLPEVADDNETGRAAEEPATTHTENLEGTAPLNISRTTSGSYQLREESFRSVQDGSMTPAKAIDDNEASSVEGDVVSQSEEQLDTFRCNEESEESHALKDSAVGFPSSIVDNDVSKVVDNIQEQADDSSSNDSSRTGPSSSDIMEEAVDVSISGKPSEATESQVLVDQTVESEVSLASSPKEPPSDSDILESGKKESNFAYRDLTSAKKNLDASSMAFTERLRGAAHRRKLRVARSRDSLAAKEREHLLSIASANERRLLMAPKESAVPVSTSSVGHVTSVEPYKPFKARPVPSTTGQVGSGGQVGVPKVEKKPTTTPFSPLLGGRRPKKERVSALHTPSQHAPRQNASRFVSLVTKSLTPKKSQGVPFKARPAPPTTGIQGHGGQVGVPKVAKRPATVPVSPGLGNRRRSLPVAFKPKTAPTKSLSAALKEEATRRTKPSSNKAFHLQDRKEAARLEQLQQRLDAERKAREFQARSLPNSSLKNTPTSTQSPILFGLKILSNQSPSATDVSGNENVEPQMATPENQRPKSGGYIPHSTIRAKKRASFDEQRALHELEREEEQERLRQSTIKQRRAELSRLRESLR